jgi:hypothetical protein
MRPREAEARNLPGALALAARLVAGGAPGQSAHVVVVTDGAGVVRGGPALARAVGALEGAGVHVTAVASAPLDEAALGAAFADAHAEGALSARVGAVEHAVPPPGDVVLDDVALSLSAVPAPARVIEVSGGDAALGLYADRYSLGEVYAGEARTEVARIALPPWVPGEPMELTVTSTYRDVGTGKTFQAQATLRGRYSEDVEQIARSRHGDVIAYASALAMVRRLHRAFLGSEVDRLGGLRRLVALQAASLTRMSEVQSDSAIGAQAEVLATLLGVIED